MGRSERPARASHQARPEFRRPALRSRRACSITSTTRRARSTTTRRPSSSSPTAPASYGELARSLLAPRLLGPGRGSRQRRRQLGQGRQDRLQRPRALRVLARAQRRLGAATKEYEAAKKACGQCNEKGEQHHLPQPRSRLRAREPRRGRARRTRTSWRSRRPSAKAAPPAATPTSAPRLGNPEAGQRHRSTLIENPAVKSGKKCRSSGTNPASTNQTV